MDSAKQPPLTPPAIARGISPEAISKWACPLPQWERAEGEGETLLPLPLNFY